tara:strand:- start:7074 stop:8546 length:1473 start_codon:yes stop_codon:yes gene_type:complete
MSFQLAQSYLQGMANPLDGVLEAYGQGQVLRQNRDTLQTQQAEQARKIQAQQELEQLDWNDMSAVSRVVAQYPEYTAGAKEYYGQMEVKAKEGLFRTMSRGVSALQSGSNQVASDLFKTQAEGYRNVGDEEAAETADWLAEMSLTSPETAQRALMLQLASVTPKDSGSNLESYGKVFNPQRKEVDTGDQIQSYAIDPVTGQVSGAEWIADKAATPDNVLDNQTSITNTTQTNMVSEGNNMRTNATSENNNIRTNTVSEGNNIRTNQQSNVNSERSALIQQYGIDEKSKNVDKQIEYNLQKQELSRNEAKLQTFGGKVYMVYKDGTAAPALDAQGNQMTDTKVDPTIQRDIRNEKVRIGKLNAILPEAEALLKNATGSRTGAAFDSVTGALGITTEGRKTTAQLEVLAGQLVSMMPRMEGPQSDKDVAMYKAMAGNISDPTKTVAERQAALKTIRRMTQKAEADLAKSEKQAGQPSGASGNDAKRSSLFTP